ncbi:MAG: hypothetical protein WDZ46_02330 [Solirubrobacterales bacterium]
MAAVLLGAPAASAKFSVFPTTLEARAKPGTVASGVFNVRMEGESARRFVVGAQDLVPQPDGSLAVARQSGSPFSASRWVSLTPSRFPGLPSRVQPVEYAVRVPPRAEPGDHLASLTVTRLPRGGASTTVPAQAVSVRLRLRVAGRIERSARVAALDAPRIAAGNPVSVVAEVVNTGNVRLDFDRAASGLLTILDGSEREARLSFAGTVYPGQRRPFELSWDQAPLFGDFHAVATVDAGNGKRVRDSASILVLPWRQIGALLLIALAAIVLLVGRSRRLYP